MENIKKRHEKDKNITISQKHDGIDVQSNLLIYDAIQEKLESTAFSIPFAKQGQLLKKGREIFGSLSVEEQCYVLLNIVRLLASGRSGGCDLKVLGGSKNTGVITNNSKLSAWKNSYKDVRIVDISASGLFKSETKNLLELL